MRMQARTYTPSEVKNLKKLAFFFVCMVAVGAVCGLFLVFAVL